MDISIISSIIGFVAFFLALSIHEFSHALAAYFYGDKTAQYEGRLTLNPIAHIDLFGTIILPVLLMLSQSGIMFGWAKPVPVNYLNLKDQKWGPAVISIAGPASNMIFLIFSLIIWNVLKIYWAMPPENLLVIFLQQLIIVNVVLMVFNMLPIFPLDGTKLLFAILPDSMENFKLFWEKNGILILFIFIIFGGGILNALFRFVLGFVEPFM